MGACLCGSTSCSHRRRTKKHAGPHPYGADHQERRRRMLEAIKAGRLPALCQRCGLGPRAGDPWEAGHASDVALGGGPEVRPEHRSCNRRAGAELKERLRKAEIEKRAQERIAATYRMLQDA